MMPPDQILHFKTDNSLKIFYELTLHIRASVAIYSFSKIYEASPVIQHPLSIFTYCRQSFLPNKAMLKPNLSSVIFKIYFEL